MPTSGYMYRQISSAAAATHVRCSPGTMLTLKLIFGVVLIAGALPWSQSLISLRRAVAHPNTETDSPVASARSGSNCFRAPGSSPTFCIVKVGAAVTLDAKAVLRGRRGLTTYSWKQVSGKPVALANAGAPVATVTGIDAFGEYDFSVTATDNRSHEFTDIERVGAVVVKGNCLIDDVPQKLMHLVGPLTQWGSSCDPWPWYDVAEVANANAIMRAYSKPASGDKAAPGTIEFSSANYPAITGTGTAFTSLPHSCDGSGCPSKGGNGTDYGIYISVWWNAEGGNDNGRFIINVPAKQIVSNTSLAPGLERSQLPSGIVPGKSYHFAWVNANDYWAPFSLISQPSYSWNYYDVVIAFYRLYYRTGIAAYGAFARRLADDWWVYAMGHGYARQMVAPRAMSLAGMMARALDGGFNARWTGIEKEVFSHLDRTPAIPGQVDVRESGYSSSFLGLLALLDPNVTASESAKSRVCAALAQNTNTFWNPLLVNDDAYGQNLFLANQTYPNSANEVEPWLLAVTATGFRDLYSAATNTCADQTTAANARKLLTQTLNFMYSYGAVGIRKIPRRNGGGIGRIGMAYLIGAPASGENAHQPCSGTQGSFAKPCVPGTIQGKAGSTTITGIATTFRSGRVFRCNGTDYIGIITENPPTVHKVVSCESDTSMIIAPPLVSAIGGDKSYYSESPPDSSTSCAPSLSKYCFFDGDSPTPDLSTDNAGIFGWLYNLTKDPKWLRDGDDLFSSWAGGPAGGPGTDGPPEGPMASGQTTSPYGYLTALPPCSAAAPPCGGVTAPGAVPAHWGKDFGLGSGWVGAADNYLAYRIMTSDGR